MAEKQNDKLAVGDRINLDEVRNKTIAQVDDANGLVLIEGTYRGVKVQYWRPKDKVELVQ